MAHRCCALVVDDNHDSADSLAMLIRMWGHQVITLYDAHSALLIEPSIEPTVAFIDIAMPNTNGYVLAARMRKDPRLKDVLLVAVSGYASDEHILRADIAGFDAHLAKPASPDMIKHILDNPKVYRSQKVPA